MKRVLLFGAMMVSLCTSSFAYNTVNVQDSISTNTHWTNNQQYLLKGYVYVTAGATLTIDSGTIIKGDKNTKGSLIIERGAKLVAIGSATAPIVFTSNQAVGNRTYGDWGGVILCGKAPTNWAVEPTVEGGPRSKYGGTDAHDNSGTMRYVRIEFPGIAFSPNNEINGLTFCGVGDATTIDHIQVSYSGDDSYEWFGGSVNAKYLISHRSWDDDFDTDNGYNGKNQFLAGLRDPFVADQSGSKGFESDSYQPGGVTNTGLNGDTSMITKPVFSNVTMAGPLVSPGSTAYDPQFVSGAHIRRGSAISILNSIIFGFPAGILIDESAATMGGTTANIANGIMQFRNNIVAGNGTFASPTGGKDVFYVKDGARSLTPTATWADTTTNNPFAPYAGPYNWLTAAANSNRTYPTEQNGVRLQNPFNLTNPDFRPTSTSPVSYNTKGNGSATAGSFNTANPINTDTSNGYANYNVPVFPPNFTTTKAADAFFTKTNYVGAFSGNLVTQENWFANWTNFDPVNADYTTYVNTFHGVTGVGVNNINKNLQNAKLFPNPTSSNATLLFELNAASNVNIYVSDLTGKVISTYAAGKKAAGISSIEINTDALQTGMYMVTILSDNNQKTVKLNVIK